MGNSCSIIYLKKKAYLILGFFFIFCSGVFSQNQRLADSLESVYLLNTYEEQDRLNLLKQLAVNHPDPEKKLFFSEKLIETAQALDSIDYLFSGFLQKGTALRNKGDLSEALKSYFQATKFTNEEKELGIINITIADVYSIMGDHNNAIHYYQSAIDILREENDSIKFASALLNAGDEYFKQRKLDSAMIFYKESGKIFNAKNYEIGVAYNLGNVGKVYAQKGRNKMAEKNINKAIEILGKLGDYPAICEYLTDMSDIYLEKEDVLTAMNFAIRSLELSERYGLKEKISVANLKLSELYEKTGNLGESYRYYKNHIAYRDSVYNIASVQQMANLRTDFEVAQKQIEVDLLNQGKRNQQNLFIATIVILGLTTVLLLTLYWYYRTISKEKKRSENLLLNILPFETAKELMKFGKVQAKKFDSVTVLFTDFQAFTHYSQKLSPEILVKSVNFYFSKFDEIIEKHGLEKIKTIGDAYMCAGGLPFPTNNHSLKILQAAFEIVEFVTESKKASNNNIAHFDVRIGINTGPVVAGVVGTTKFAYDIWGDTVNVASRMESLSEPGKINISENTYNLIKDKYECEYRGEFHIKNKGMVKMYFANNVKPKELYHDIQEKNIEI